MAYFRPDSARRRGDIAPTPPEPPDTDHIDWTSEVERPPRDTAGLRIDAAMDVIPAPPRPRDH
ncbi:hypothetical protein SAMN04490244_104230 [Tranquillimonas rosea]|uniref:Uncharacterized protein n=1 Tax=Tranquillimonas rosea TaxID=641238 RepID=A0A1H9TKE1_9RHOB|nr:hypothetical protein [Tranquillimonas rosea]SER97464.1 hypothetical protein SAMN04490244_104230 [Tranquillimonas rosea]